MFSTNGIRIGAPSFLQEGDYLKKYAIREAAILDYKPEGDMMRVLLKFPNKQEDSYVIHKRLFPIHDKVVQLNEARPLVHTYFLGDQFMGVTSTDLGFKEDITSRF